MANEIRYTSIFSPNKKVTAAQYIIELVCKNKATYFKLELPIKFWDFPEWRGFYQAQLKRCHYFLGKYDESILIAVIRSKNIFSLLADWIEAEFIKEQNKMDSQDRDTKHERIMDSKGLQTKKQDFSNLD